VRAELRFLALWMLTMGAGVLRAAINFGSGDVPARVYTSDPAMLFDFSLDAETASAALIVGIMFYIPRNGELHKPGTNNVITATDVAFCSCATILAFIAVIAMPILAHAWEPQGLTKGIITIVIPDIFALAALAVAVIELT
jgi:hypothetical protein